LAVLAVSVFLTSCEQENIEDTIGNMELSRKQISVGERIINDYIEQKHQLLDIEVRQKGSKAHLDFLFEVRMGDYSDLTGKDSDYIKSPEELKAVIDFIMEERAHLYNNYPADGMQNEKEAEAIKEDNSLHLLKGGYNRTKAKNYALDWAKGRNKNYPDFANAGGDCTNFISQAVHAGGIAMRGTGDGCEHEVNSSEWYVHSGGSRDCKGGWSNWEWSTPWAAAWPFRNYHAYKIGNATSLGWTTSASIADRHLGVGDVVQMQKQKNGSWSTYHTMIVTEDIHNDLKVSYHDTDNRNKKLSDIERNNTIIINTNQE